MLEKEEAEDAEKITQEMFGKSLQARVEEL